MKILARPEGKPKTEIAARLRAIRAALGIEDRDIFAERTGIAKSTIGNYERGDRVPDAAMLQLYREAWDVDLNWVITGEGSHMFLTADHPLPEPVQAFLDARKRKPRQSAPDNAKSTGKDLIADRILDGREPNFVYLPYLEEVSASAGPGAAAPFAPAPSSMVAFDSEFLRNKGAAPDRCTVITARGDSMVPTIPDGSLLVVDHSQTQISNGFIMVINLGDDLLVKRVRRRLDGLIDLISDNQAYAPETIGPDTLQQLRIVGRVVYFCRVP